MKRTKLILSKYFLISLTVHLSVIALVLYLIHDMETDIGLPSIEIGLIESPSGNEKDDRVRRFESQKITKKQATNTSVSKLPESDKYLIRPEIEKTKPEKKLSESKLNRVESKENDSYSVRSDSASYKSKAVKKNSGLIQAHPDYRYNPKPKYPMIAKRRGYEGTVLLNVYVLESGKVGELNLEKPSGFPVLDESAINSVKKWLFVPGKRDGISVSSWVQVPIKFQLTNI